MYDIGKFYQAADMEDAMRTLVGNPEAVVTSGGSGVLIRIREGKLAGCSLVNIHGIKELKGIRMEEGGTIVIDPATTFSHIANDDIIQKHVPMLEDAVGMAGGSQLRNIGTIGGNICNDMASVDSANNLYYLDAVLVLREPDDVEEVSISRWCTRPGRTVRSHDEVLTAIRIKKKNCQDYGGQCIKYGKRNAVKIATLGFAVSVRLTGDKKHIQDLRLAYGVTAPIPICCHTTEEAVGGVKMGEALAQTVGKGALEEVNPRSSWRASKEFRPQLVEEPDRRTVKQAVINTGGEWDA